MNQLTKSDQEKIDQQANRKPIEKIIVQVVDYKTGKRTEPFSTKVNEINDMLEIFVSTIENNLDAELGVLVITEHTKEGEVYISRQPLYRMETFYRVAEQYYNG